LLVIVYSFATSVSINKLNISIELLKKRASKIKIPKITYRKFASERKIIKFLK